MLIYSRQTRQGDDQELLSENTEMIGRDIAEKDPNQDEDAFGEWCSEMRNLTTVIIPLRETLIAA